MNGLEIKITPTEDQGFLDETSGRRWLGAEMGAEKGTPLTEAIFRSPRVSIETRAGSVFICVRGKEAASEIVKHHASDLMSFAHGKVEMRPVRLSVNVPEVSERLWRYRSHLLWEERNNSLSRRWAALKEPIMEGLEGKKIPSDFLDDFMVPFLWKNIVQIASDYGEEENLLGEDPQLALHIEKVKSIRPVTVGGSRMSMLTDVRWASPVSINGAPVHIGRLRARGYGRVHRIHGRQF